MYCPACGTQNTQEARFCLNCGQPLSEPRAAVQPAGLRAAVESSVDGSTGRLMPNQPPSGVQHAGFWIRALAWLVDALLMNVALTGLLVTAGFTPEEIYSTKRPQAAVVIIGIVAHWLYQSLLESSTWQSTVGKKLLGLRVVNTEGSRIGFGRATARHFSMFISSFILGIGFIMVAFTKRKQGLHDKLAGTLVIRPRNSKAAPNH